MTNIYRRKEIMERKLEWEQKNEFVDEDLLKSTDKKKTEKWKLQQ